MNSLNILNCRLSKMSLETLTLFAEVCMLQMKFILVCSFDGILSCHFEATRGPFSCVGPIYVPLIRTEFTDIFHRMTPVPFHKLDLGFARPLPVNCESSHLVLAISDHSDNVDYQVGGKRVFFSVL